MTLSLFQENIIVDYKQITKQLSSKLERKEERGAVAEGDAGNPLDKALSRVQVAFGGREGGGQGIL